jgi:hypothetical protein
LFDVSFDVLAGLHQAVATALDTVEGGLNHGLEGLLG